MGYPSQPHDPYGQHPQQQPYASGPQYPPQYGSGPQQPYGYGYQQPTPPPPPKKSNVGLIVLLAVGIPLLLLGGCGVVVAIIGSADTGGRESLVTEADEPNAVMPSNAPVSSAPPAETNAPEPEPEQASTATVGGAITLQGRDPGLKVKVTVTKVVDPGTPAQDFMKPKTGNKFVALEITMENVGQTVYSDSPTNGAMLIDGEGQQYRTTLFDVREGQSLNGSATINAGDTRKGMIVFEVPESTKPAKFQMALNSGFADQKGEWTLS
jgi:archaellum component FlaG (FlaF/FlaG flagellin family)